MANATRIILQVRGPVETFGEYLCWSDGYMRLRATEFSECAISFGSKTSARRFAKLHERDLSVYAVPVKQP